MNNFFTLFPSIPAELAENLIKEFGKLHKNYFLGRWDSSQLNGGRFGEAILRVLEYKNTGTYTPIGTTVLKRHIVTQIAQNTNMENSLRLYIPSLAEIIMDFRNNRNVAHLASITVNSMDSTLVIQAANWIVAELIRIEMQISPYDAEKEIKKIIERKVPIIEELGNRLKILNPKLNTKEKILILCYQRFPTELLDSDLIDWTDYGTKNSGRFRKYLKELSKESLIDYRNNKVILTKLGVAWVEKNIEFELSIK